MKRAITFILATTTFYSIFAQESLKTWELYQDSIRARLLEKSGNVIIKNSVLQELYIKKLVTERGDSVHFELPFDLHGLDCGAPDCYSTNLSFSIPLESNQIFPPQIMVDFTETGCVDKEIFKKVQFDLSELSQSFLKYHSKEINCLLIILKTDKRKEYLYLLNNVDEEFVNEGNFYEILELLEENENDPKVPYRSTIARMNDYQYFLK